ncbi:MAG: VIT domain-containing protein [Bacteroidota bacterium]
MKRTILCAIISCVCTFSIHSSLAQGYMYITDPQQFWSYSRGFISEASYVIEPQGAYVQLEMILEISIDPQANYGPDDSLEVVYSFYLPKNSIVYDSWLWIDNYISYGIIMDEDSAKQIYEDIVDRRTDPSILRKWGSSTYNLRIFPITKNMPRKVKISVLLPTEWTEDEIFTTLPVDHVMQYLSGTNLEIFVKEDSLFSNPSLPEDDSLNFQLMAHPLYGDVLELSLQETDTVGNQTLVFDSPMEDGLFASIYPTQQNEGYYQLAIFPSKDSFTIPPTKTLILLDYDSTNTPNVQEMVTNIALTEFSPTDSFNFMLNTPTGIQAASSGWLPADSATLAQNLGTGQLPLAGSSDLINLIREGLDFMSQEGNVGSIILISNSSDYASYWLGNDALDSLTINDTIHVPMHIANIRKWDNEFYWDPSICNNSCGNEYLFYQLAQVSGGSVHHYRTYGESLNMILTHPFVTVTQRAQQMSVSSNIGSDSLQLSCYPDEQPLNRAYVEVGKYTGTLPFQGTLDMHIQQQSFQIPFQFDQTTAHLSDTMLRKAWAGMKVYEIERGPWYSTWRDDIVALSVQERVLSSVTAFLCLEDSNANGFAEPTQPVSIEEPEQIDLIRVRAYPNPFHHEGVQIDVDNITPKALEKSTLTIFTLQGQTVFEFALGHEMLHGRTAHMYWDGRDMRGEEMPAGVYFLLLTGPEVQEVIRLLKR